MNCNNTFSKTIKELYEVYDELLIVAKLKNELTIISPIAKDVVAIVPYVDDISIVSKNISAVKTAYRNAQIAKDSSDIAVRAKDISIEKAQQALSSSNTANLSALFAGERAEWIETNTTPILENIEVIKLSPQNAQIAKDNSDIAVHAKDISIQKAREAKDSSNSAHLSALFAGERAEHIDEVSNTIDNKEIEIIGIIDEHEQFVALSTSNIEAIKQLLLRKASETQLAKEEAVNSAVVATQKAQEAKSNSDYVRNAKSIVLSAKNETVVNRNLSKRYRDETVINKNIVSDLRNQTANLTKEAKEYSDKSEEIYDEIKSLDSVYDIKKEMYTTRTGTLYEIRGDITRP
ncbi:hypothetical protein MNB_SV-13-132 [hydrothermal vent metagenome]|uniref:Uncharacterized protein n=1 Tax=hydrothermal vent metagenome TaxID=652676 RepID=A0A1W1CYK8_9ZZZZ